MADIQRQPGFVDRIFPEEMIRPSQRQIDELPYVDRAAYSRTPDTDSDLRVLGRLVARTGLGIGVIGVASDILINTQIADETLAIGASGFILGIAIAAADR